MTKKIARIALGGVICGMAVAVMMLSSLLTGLSYALPMIAGAMLIIPAIEFGTRAALTSYAAIGILSMILPADKESALMFIFLFGAYPLLKKYFEMIPRSWAEYTVKFVYFNLAAAGAVLLSFYIFGIPIDDGSLGKWAIPLLLAMGNVLFIVYDIALTKFVSLYVYRLQTILHKVFHIK